MMPTFTPTQGRYLSFIHAYIEGFGLPPAETEIAEAMGVQPPSVNGMMKTLEKKQLIRRTPGVARSIEILVNADKIPRWTKKIKRTVREWIYTGPPLTPELVAERTGRPLKHQFPDLARSKNASKSKSKPTSNPNTASHIDVYRFKISLLDFKPLIWRRIETENVGLGELHELIQSAMGWTNSHMHQFKISGQFYSDPRFMIDAFDDFGAVDYSEVSITDLVNEHGTKLKFIYEYDFGDCWQHEVKLEKISDPEPKASYPRCIAGERACPPEDVGGVYGFAEFLDAIDDPEHEQHDHLLEWVGEFDLNEFDKSSATREMKQGLPAW